MSSYLDRHAELYDIFYADKPYRREAEFVAECLAANGVEPGSRVLELACGTGRHAFEFERLGFRMTSTDYSQDMLKCAVQAKEARGSKVDFMRQDMRSLDLPGPPFDAAISLFDSIGYVQTNEALLATLAGLKRHLRAGGLVLLEFWHAGAMLRSFEPIRVRRWSTAHGEVLRISETRLDCRAQLAHVTYTILETSADGAFQKIVETQTNRYFLVQEMSGWLDRAGFEPLRWLSGFDATGEIDCDTWHVVVVARLRA